MSHPNSISTDSRSWQHDIRIVLVQPRNPLNIGAAARAMANFGFTDLAVVEPYSEAWRQARSARVGTHVLAKAREFATLADALWDRQHVIGTTSGTARTPEVALVDWRAAALALPPLRCAVVFGSEKTGLRVDDISYCHQLARIPTLPDADSMNLGQAVAICCYELARGRGEFPVTPKHGAMRQSAPLRDRERVVSAFIPLLEHLGVFRVQHRATQTRRLRQMLLQWHLTASDVRLLLGVARELRRVLHVAASAADTKIMGETDTSA